jgi:hypothetical protein
MNRKSKLERFNNLLGKIIKFIKPDGVLDIEFDLEPLSYKDNEYYLSVVYVVDDDSKFLRSSDMRASDFVRQKWNSTLKINIESFLGLDVIITNSGIRSKSYNEQLKRITI